MFIHPFRAPADHAGSLLRQHLQARRRHQDDAFSRRYAGWLGHHEFGLDHRPLSFTDAPFAGDSLKLDYWRAYWDDVHAHLLGQPPVVAARQVFLDADALRREPVGVLTVLARKVGCVPLDPAIVLRTDSVIEPQSEIHAALMSRAEGAPG